jgi:hypothetical protein
MDELIYTKGMVPILLSPLLETARARIQIVRQSGTLDTRRAPVLNIRH